MSIFKNLKNPYRWVGWVVSLVILGICAWGYFWGPEASFVPEWAAGFVEIAAGVLFGGWFVVTAFRAKFGGQLLVLLGIGVVGYFIFSLLYIRFVEIPRQEVLDACLSAEVTEIECPEELQRLVDAKVGEAYNRGVEDGSEAAVGEVSDWLVYGETPVALEHQQNLDARLQTAADNARLELNQQYALALLKGESLPDGQANQLFFEAIQAERVSATEAAYIVAADYVGNGGEGDAPPAEVLKWAMEAAMRKAEMRGCWYTAP